MKLSVIACKVMEKELRFCQPQDSEFVFLEQGLHRTPNKLRQRIQGAINQLSSEETRFILLGYGLCSNGVVGVRSIKHPLIVPKAHDCISLLLGSLDRYRQEFKKEPGTYYLSPGWIEEKDTPIAIYEEYAARYGKETAHWIIQEEFKNYRRLALIDTGVCPLEEYRAEARKNADFLGLRYEELQGSLDMLRQFLMGRWGLDFIVLGRNEETTQDLFL